MLLCISIYCTRSVHMSTPHPHPATHAHSHLNLFFSPLGFSRRPRRPRLVCRVFPYRQTWKKRIRHADGMVLWWWNECESGMFVACGDACS